MDKLLALYDNFDNIKDKKEDYRTFKTSIDIINSETGKIIFKGLKNKVIIPGSGLIARKLFDITSNEITPSYNTVLGINTPSTDTAPDESLAKTAATKDNHKILLFCCGIDGCGDQNSQVYPVDYTKWIAPIDMVPFRYQLKTNDISNEMRETYFGRVETDTHIAYYFKRFENIPHLVQQFIDGTLVTSDIYNSAKKDAAETYVEMNLKITKQDIRDYFVATVGIENARINTISLCSAYPVMGDDGFMYFKEIRPVTKLNFPNEQFIDVSKGIDIIYHVYM